MRPYRFRIRLSSRRLNVTRLGTGLGTGPAAACRAAARLSLGSASSDIELMGAPPLSSQRHDCANRARLQEAQWRRHLKRGAVAPALKNKRRGAGVRIPALGGLSERVPSEPEI